MPYQYDLLRNETREVRKGMVSPLKGRLGKKVCLAVIMLALVEGGLPAARAADLTIPQPPEVSCDAALLMEWHTGAVLFEKNGFKRMHPASLTKMMTALVALERGRLDDLVRVSYEAASQPGSTMYLKEGDVFTLEDLLFGLMLNSGNDAAWAIAEHIGKGSPEDFFQLMNSRAREIGAINTRFKNPHGLTDPNHYTTAFDLALIARTCLKHPYFQRLVATKEKDVIEAGKQVKISLYNTNRLLWLRPGADGVKTGTTEAAGQCLVASATKDGMRLIVVILDSQDRWSDAQCLLDYGFSNYRLAKVASAGETILTLPCIGSHEKYVPVQCLQDLSACVPRFAVGLRTEISLPRYVKGNCARGTILGQANLYLGDRVVGYADLVAGSWVNARTPVGVLVRLASSALKTLVSSGLF
ncbi:MAG TPA: D-alanyl-D-alanine carboxypeptidase [Firmicutes bacterium]|nr:D-alanyl-D-alanine carboxypeptidase [Candidatus Fermentithermobacillaceae bacterium]